MRNVTCLGLCWATTFALVAVALGQQAPVEQYIQLTPPPSENGAVQPGGASNFQPGPAASAPRDQSVLTGANTWQPSQHTAASSGQQRGELGVWLIESSGPGVQIQSVTRGSSADQAGLRSGDIILQVNGKGASSPQVAAQSIRQIQLGQSGTMSIWRDGDQQQIQFTIQPVKQVAEESSRDASHQVSFNGSESGGSGELTSRTAKLEQQIASLTQELQQVRQELAQLKSSSAVQQTRYESTRPEGFAPPAPPQHPPLGPPVPGPAANPPAAIAPPPGFAAPEEKVTPATPPVPPKAETPPPAEKSASSDPFGSPPPAQPPQPKAEEKPKGEEKPKADAKPEDDLFK